MNEKPKSVKSVTIQFFDDVKPFVEKDGEFVRMWYNTWCLDKTYTRIIFERGKKRGCFVIAKMSPKNAILVAEKLIRYANIVDAGKEAERIQSIRSQP